MMDCIGMAFCSFDTARLALFGIPFAWHIYYPLPARTLFFSWFLGIFGFRYGYGYGYGYDGTWIMYLGQHSARRHFRDGTKKLIGFFLSRKKKRSIAARISDELDYNQ